MAVWATPGGLESSRGEGAGRGVLSLYPALVVAVEGVGQGVRAGGTAEREHGCCHQQYEAHRSPAWSLGADPSVHGFPSLVASGPQGTRTRGGWQWGGGSRPAGTRR